MALVVADRVLETATSPGTGAVSLLGAVSGYVSFLTGIGNGNTTYYTIADQSGANWEVGLGTYNSTGSVLTRTTPIAGSAATPVNFVSGTQNVFVTQPAEKAVYGTGTTLVAPTGTLLPVANGGTGVATLTGIAYGNGTSAFTAASTAQVLSVIGTVPIANGGTGLTSFTSGGAVYATSTSALTTGTLPIASGGTNSTATPTAGTVAYGTGTAIAYTAAGTSGQILTSAAAGTPTWITTLPIANGGTNSTATPTAGGAGYGTGTAHAYTAAGTSGQALISAGAAAPAFGALAIGTANTNVSGALTATNGGTGVATLSGIAFGNGTSAFTAATSAQVLSVIGTTASVQFGSFGVGTAASGTAGEIRATNNVTAYYSSDRKFKENIEDIPNALKIVDAIGGKLFDWTDAYLNAHGGEDDYFLHKHDFGVIAQDVQAVFPRAVRIRPDGSLAVDYDKLIALAFAAIKELKRELNK